MLLRPVISLRAHMHGLLFGGSQLPPYGPYMGGHSKAILLVMGGLLANFARFVHVFSGTRRATNGRQIGDLRGESRMLRG